MTSPSEGEALGRFPPESSFDGAVLAGIPQDLWPRAAAAGHRLLMVDYDGTLAPFRTDPCHAAPLGPAVAILQAIASLKRTTVVVVSGRPVAELQALLPATGFTLIGENGWEEMGPGGAFLRHDLSREHRRAIFRAAVCAATEPWGWRIERKRASLMLHTRGLPPEEAHRVEREGEAVWEPEARRSGLRLLSVTGGIELRAPGRDKGTVAADLLARSPEGTFPVHVGDDATDEDAFGTIASRGVGILIGDPAEPSSASGRLRSWFDLPIFLKRWLAVLERPDSGLPGDERERSFARGLLR